MTDMINPNHYRGDRQFEPIAVIEDWGLNYRLGNAVKYISRNGRKPGEDRIEGLKKAIWYLEREIEALKPSQYSVTYQDVLEDFAACAAEGNEPILEYGNWGAAQEVPFTWDGQDSVDFSFSLSGSDGPVGSGGTDTIFSVNDFWMEDGQPDYVTGYEDAFDPDVIKSNLDAMWDPTLGPIEISQEEIDGILSRKALDQFDDDEIVSTVERRGMIIGFKKDGSSCILKDGRCV